MKKKVISETEDFPQVWKMDKTVEIIYRGHAEFYVFKDRFQEKDYDPYSEIDMVKGNGGRRVHGKKTVKVIDFTR